MDKNVMPYTFLDEDKESDEKYQFVENDEQEEKSFSPHSAALKGLLKGTIDLGRMLGPLIDESPKSAYEAIEGFLPSKGTPLEKGIERGSRIFPTAAIGGGNIPQTLSRSLLAGTSGQALEEAGLPPILQTGAEILSFGAPSPKKNITPTQSQKQLVDFAKQQGMTNKQIAPIISGEKKLKYLSKLAFRRGKTKTILEDTNKGLGNIYDNLRKSESAQQSLSDDLKRDFLSKFMKKFEEIPSSERKKISDDFKDLLSKPLTGDSLMNFYQDINHQFSRGATKLGALKSPIEETISKISPELNLNFKLTNQLYAKYANIRNKLKPSIASDVVSASEALRLGVGIMTGYYPVLIESIGEVAARKVATEFLINPRLQNLSNKTIEALNSGKFAQANLFKKEMMKELESESDSEMYFLLEDIDFTELRD